MQYLNMLPYQVREAIDKNYPVALPWESWNIMPNTCRWGWTASPV